MSLLTLEKSNASVACRRKQGNVLGTPPSSSKKKRPFQRCSAAQGTPFIFFFQARHANDAFALRTGRCVLFRPLCYGSPYLEQSHSTELNSLQSVEIASCQTLYAVDVDRVKGIAVTTGLCMGRFLTIRTGASGQFASVVCR